MERIAENMIPPWSWIYPSGKRWADDYPSKVNDHLVDLVKSGAASQRIYLKNIDGIRMKQHEYRRSGTGDPVRVRTEEEYIQGVLECP